MMLTELILNPESFFCNWPSLMFICTYINKLKLFCTSVRISPSFYRCHRKTQTPSSLKPSICGTNTAGRPCTLCERTRLWQTQRCAWQELKLTDVCVVCHLLGSFTSESAYIIQEWQYVTRHARPLSSCGLWANSSSGREKH